MPLIYNQSEISRPTITPQKLSITETRTKGLKDTKHPRTLRGLRSFLGVCNVYRQFVPNYSRIAAPPNHLLKKAQQPTLPALDDTQALKFKTIIEAILSSPILSLPRPGLPSSVHTDACGHQLGTALFQTQPEGGRKPLGCLSRTLLPAEKNYSALEKECLTVVSAIQTLLLYLQDEHFIVHSDQSSLQWLMGITEPSGRLMWRRLWLCEFAFDIVYKKGNFNNQNNALSRLTSLGHTTVPLDNEIPTYF